MIDVPIRVKDALRDGRRLKNYRFNVLDDEGNIDFTIDNNTLVSESVKIDERMCSDDTIKFGLCEGSSLEFQYFNHPNITDRQLQAFCDVDYGESEPYTIPMGFFTVKNCSRQASTGIIKVAAYNKLQSDYLDAKANALIEETISDTEDANVITLQTLQDYLLKDYQIEPKEERAIVSSSSGGIGNHFTDIKCNVIGYSGQWTPEISTGYSFNYLQGDINGQRVRIENLKIYVNLLNTVISEIKEAWFEKISNAQTTWESFKKKFLYMCGITVYHHSDNNYAYWGFYTIDELYRPNNDYTPNNDFLYASAYSRLLDSNMEYLKIPLFNDERNTRSLLKFIIPTGIDVWQGDTGVEIWSYKNSVTFYDWRKDCPLRVYAIPSDNIENIELNKADMPDVTLRDFVSANYELHCQFGQLSRETDLFGGVELNHSRLLPQETLYPGNDLYPGGAAESGFKSQYSKLWADEGNIHKWKYLIITYKGLDEENKEKDFTLQRTVNEDGTDNYNCSDNWLFRNLIWTAEQIGEYADAMVEKMRDVTWFPFEMWCAGLPYIETGDEIEIPLGEHSYTSYILQRQLDGIQNLQDTYINGTLDIF